MSTVTLELAKALIATTLRLAKADPAAAVSVAVVDRHGNLVAFERQDGATLASALSAQSKSWTAAAIGAPTKALKPHTEPGQMLFNLPFASGYGHPPFVPIAGGVPIVNEAQELLGAIGVGGLPTPDADHELAEQALGQLAHT